MSGSGAAALERGGAKVDAQRRAGRLRWWRDRLREDVETVVIETVPEGATVVGVPGRVVRINGRRLDARPLDILDHARLPDPVVETLRCLVDRVELLEKQMRDVTRMTPVGREEEVPVACTWLGQSK